MPNTPTSISFGTVQGAKAIWQSLSSGPLPVVSVSRKMNMAIPKVQ
jgi:hypothetical protein